MKKTDTVAAITYRMVLRLTTTDRPILTLMLARVLMVVLMVNGPIAEFR